jgi:hypothetical protein
MTSEFDFKGKHFTNIVNKLAVPVTIKTSSSLIRGVFHIRPDTRIKDELNDIADGTFAAITDATVYDSLGVKLYSTKFLALNRDTIEWLIVDDSNTGE